MSNFISIRDAAEILGVTEKTIRNRIKSGEIPAEKREGLNGPQFFIPSAAITEPPKMMIDVLAVKKPIRITELSGIIRDQVKEDLQSFTERIETQNEMTKEELKAEINQLSRSIEELQKTLEQVAASQNKKPWWKRK